MRRPSVAATMDDDYTVKSHQQQAEALKATAQTVLRGLDWADSQLTCSVLQAAAGSAGTHTVSCKAQCTAGKPGPADAGGQGCCAPAGHPLYVQAARQTACLRQGQHVGKVLALTQPLQSASQQQLESGDASSIGVTAAGALHSGSEQHGTTGGDRSHCAQHAASHREGLVGGARGSSGVLESESAEGDGHGSAPYLLHQQERLLAEQGVSVPAASSLQVAHGAGTQDTA
ncbi:hypothetical protein ABBQ38_001997 [Trebouxia sp. C0009 RCD-2024]